VEPPPPPPPGPKPDLIVTEFQLDHVTVQNQGLGAAGPFRVTMDDTISSRHESFTGLAAGATVTRTIDPPLGCHGWTSFVDDLTQVAERTRRTVIDVVELLRVLADGVDDEAAPRSSTKPSRSSLLPAYSAAGVVSAEEVGTDAVEVSDQDTLRRERAGRTAG
jgi:hypothetical protein